MADTVIEHVTEGFKDAVGSFVKDLAALTHEDLNRSWADNSRRAYDFVYEVSVINKRVACRLRGEDPGPMPWKFGEGWLEAPIEMRDTGAITELFEASANEILEAANLKTNEDQMAVLDLVGFATMHTMYHDAQLNFIQSLKGDLAIHW